MSLTPAYASSLSDVPVFLEAPLLLISFPSLLLAPAPHRRVHAVDELNSARQRNPLARTLDTVHFGIFNAFFCVIQIRTLGGEFGGIQKLKAWTDYFPYVSAEKLRGNYHKQLNQLQGRKRTYLVGEIFNLPLVSECVDWSRYLIKKFFKDQRNVSPRGTTTKTPTTTAPAPSAFTPRGSSPAPTSTAASSGKAQHGAAPVASR
eukprot:6175692-Pleurochrysis_carterae.AAC.4